MMCKKIASNVEILANDVADWGDDDEDDIYEDEIEDKDSDQDEYAHSFGNKVRFKPFDLDKENYIIFAQYMVRCYDEIKRVSIKLEYLYTHTFYYKQQLTPLSSETLHLGLFHSIVLIDPDILVINNIRSMLGRTWNCPSRTKGIQDWIQSCFWPNRRSSFNDVG